MKSLVLKFIGGESRKRKDKSGCLLRVETTINKPDLPGLKLKKPAINYRGGLFGDINKAVSLIMSEFKLVS